MITVGFKNHYRAVHLTSEFGNYIFGGVATHIGEQYRYRDGETGFIHHRFELDFDLKQDYGVDADLAIITDDDVKRLAEVDCDILVVHYFGQAHLITPELLQRHKVVYIMHSIPTSEPMPRAKGMAFCGHKEIEQSVRKMCECAQVIIMVSHAEKAKLGRIWPEFLPKTVVIHNGITMPPPETITIARPGKQRIGFMSRSDYRKGLLETMKAMRELYIELEIASDVAEKLYYMPRITEYIAASGLSPRLHWHGFCVGERKRAFIEYCDAIVEPSLYEPFCYVVLEPLAYGKPMIVANNGGPGEIVGPDYRYQFDPYSRDGYVEVMHKFIDDPPERVMEETSRLIERLPLFDGRRMAEKYQSLLGAL